MSEDLSEQWYWDRRTNKAYYPLRSDGDTVELLTVWHRDEVADALAEGALTTVEDIGTTGPDRPGTTFDLVESFRVDEETAARYTGDE
ncbi:MAG: hypothetical protein ABEH77_01705 [Halobacteriaceae archaeon]